MNASKGKDNGVERADRLAACRGLCLLLFWGAAVLAFGIGLDAGIRSGRYLPAQKQALTATGLLPLAPLSSEAAAGYPEQRTPAVDLRHCALLPVVRPGGATAACGGLP